MERNGSYYSHFRNLFAEAVSHEDALPSHMATDEHWEPRYGKKIQDIAHPLVKRNACGGTVHIPANSRAARSADALVMRCIILGRCLVSSLLSYGLASCTSMCNLIAN